MDLKREMEELQGNLRGFEEEEKSRGREKKRGVEMLIYVEKNEMDKD